MMLKYVIVLAMLMHYGNGHTYHTGECPSVAPMTDFDMKRFVGIWYAVQKTATASTCLVYNISRGEEPGEYFIEQTSQHFALGLTPLKHEYSYTGQISIPDTDIPAKMRVKFPLNVAGDSQFTVFMTDYDTYAGLFTCQKVTFAHRQSATLLSRTKELDKMYTDKMRTRLSSFGVDPYDLSIVSQAGCPKDADQGYNIHIDPDTFSAANIANVVRKAGEKLGDGVEWTLETSKKLYRQFATNGTDADAENLPTAQSADNDGKRAQVSVERNMQPDSDAEWVRFK